MVALLRDDKDLVAVTVAEAAEPDIRAWLRTLTDVGHRKAVVVGGIDGTSRHTETHDREQCTTTEL